MTDAVPKERLRMSLYVNNSDIGTMDDLRYLMSLDGRNLRALPDFTDIVDGLVYYYYYRLSAGPNETKMRLIRKLIEDPSIRALKRDDIEVALETPNKYPYPQALGYTSKIVLLKESQRKVIDTIVEIISKEITIPERQDYSEITKKIVTVILQEQTLVADFFEIVYLGNLYGLLPVTILKLYSTGSHRLIELEDSELKKIKFIRSDSSLISELHRIQDKVTRIRVGKQAAEMEKELYSKRNGLWSLVSDFNYVDSYYGYIISKFYLANRYRSLTSLIADISMNDILKETFSKLTPRKKSTLYLYYFALYRYRLEMLSGEAIRQFAVDSKEMDNMTKFATIVTSVNPFDRPSDLF